MSSPLLALFTRSLREDTRAKNTYSIRGGLAAVTFLAGLVAAAILSYRSSGAQAIGLAVFMPLIWVQGLAVTVMGLSWFASAISEEKEESTLGLLRMTNLNPLSILVGKSTSRLCSALLVLLAPLPFAILTATLGGISLGQIQAAYATLLAYTFLLSNVALLWSVVTRTMGWASFGTFVTVLFFFCAPALVNALRQQLLWSDWLAEGSAAEQSLQALARLAQIASPIVRLQSIPQTGFADDPLGWQVGSNVLGGLLCFALAWAGFAWFAHRTSSDSVGADQWSARFLRSKRARPWKNALAWKDFHFLAGGWPALVFRLFFYGAAVIAAIVGPVAGAPTLGESCKVALVVLPILELASIGGRIFGTELRAQTWSSLALLPTSTRAIALRKLLGFAIAFFPVAVAALVVFFFSLAHDRWFLEDPRLANAALVSMGFGAVAAGFWVALLSLWIRWGAPVLGLTIGVVLWGYLQPVGSQGLIALVLVVLSWAVGREILQRLETLAGEG